MSLTACAKTFQEQLCVEEIWDLFFREREGLDFEPVSKTAAEHGCVQRTSRGGFEIRETGHLLRLALLRTTAFPCSIRLPPGGRERHHDPSIPCQRRRTIVGDGQNQMRGLRRGNLRRDEERFRRSGVLN